MKNGVVEATQRSTGEGQVFKTSEPTGVSMALTTRRLVVLLQGDPRAPHQVRLGAALLGRGHRVIVVNAPEIAQRIRDEYGLDCEELSLASKGAHWWRVLRQWWALRNVKADVVHINYILLMYETWLDIPGAPPYVVTAWGSDLHKVMERPAKQIRIMQRILRHAAAITADSFPLLDRAKSLCADEVPSNLVLWGVDRHVFSRERVANDTAQWREQLGISPGQRVVLSPRQQAPSYHPEDIVRGFAKSLWSKDAILIIKCHGRPMEETYVDQLRNLAQSLGVEEQIRFAPACSYDRLPGLYCLANVAISALHTDGFPATFPELFALGVPVVASNIPGYAGLLDDGKNALLFAPGDVGALASALDRLITDATLAERLVNEGEAFVDQRADFKVTVEAFESLYYEAVAKRKGT